MKKIAGIVKKVLSDKNLIKVANAAFICNRAKKIFKETFKDKDFIREIKIYSYCGDKKTLCVLVPNSFYSQEIKLKESEIMGLINKKVDIGVVERILFKLGP